MKELKEELKPYVKQMIDAASSTPEHEAGGALWIDSEGKYYLDIIKNEAPNPNERFRFSWDLEVEHRLAGHERVYLWHSHPKGGSIAPSSIDYEQVKLCECPWLIVEACNYAEVCHLEGGIELDGDHPDYWEFVENYRTGFKAEERSNVAGSPKKAKRRRAA